MNFKAIGTQRQVKKIFIILFFDLKYRKIKIFIN